MASSAAIAPGCEETKVPSPPKKSYQPDPVDRARGKPSVMIIALRWRTDRRVVGSRSIRRASCDRITVALAHQLAQVSLRSKPRYR
jgi:hypothetical protein